jgi:hypothetical protein
MKWSWLTLLLACLAGQVEAQIVRVGVHGVGVAHAEITDERRVFGGGIGGMASLRVKRFGLDVTGFIASLDSTNGGGDAFDVRQADLRVSYAFTRGLAVEIGGGQRKTDPEFAATDVSMGRIGLLSEIPVSRAGGFWGRGAYLVGLKFNGGGEAGLAFEVGFGAGFGTKNGRFRVRVEYEYQRIDRTVNQVDVPIQVSVAKLGLDLGF